MSKFSYEVLARCVYPHVTGDDPDVILGAAFGEDVALTRVGDDILVSHVDPIIGAIQNIGWLAVNIACNDVATSGIPPRWIHVLLLVPSQEDEATLDAIMADISRAARELGVAIIGGHTGYSSGINRPLVAVNALGIASGRVPVLTSGARVGDLVLVTKGIALEGTAILAHDFEEIAVCCGLGDTELAEARQLMEQVSVVAEALALADSGVSSMHDVTRGGVLETFLEIALLSGVALEVEYASIPIPSIVSRFSRAFDFDPLGMISSGTLVATVHPENKARVGLALEELRTSYAFVGHVQEGVGVTIQREGSSTRYTELRAEKDELARMWELYPRGN